MFHNSRATRTAVTPTTRSPEASSSRSSAARRPCLGARGCGRTPSTTLVCACGAITGCASPESCHFAANRKELLARNAGVAQQRQPLVSPRLKRGDDDQVVVHLIVLADGKHGEAEERRPAAFHVEHGDGVEPHFAKREEREFGGFAAPEDRDATATSGALTKHAPKMPPHIGIEVE